ncbi:MAG TPA: hypothetical protein VK858_05460 [Longimicrobiales bacterium]|nr:hypothetical protein [Longimicrobiales bacterium]
MYTHVLAALRPAASVHPLEASIPTEPSALFVYALVLIALFLVWKGSRGAGEAPHPPDGADADPGAEQHPPSRSEGTPRRKRRKKQPINWVQ